MGNQEKKQIRQILHELLGLGERTDIALHRSVPSGFAFQLGNVVWVGEKSHVENQIRVRWHTESKSEGNHRSQDGLACGQSAELRLNELTQFMHVHAAGIDYDPS